MDWLSKIEEERRQKAAAEQDANENRRRADEEVKASLAAVEARLRPTLDPLVDNIERRLSLRLGVRLTRTELTVTAPKQPKSDLVHEHRIVFSHPQGGTRVRVKAIRADQINRSTEYMPSDMKLAEWRGEDQVVIDGEVNVEDLLKGDLQLLTEWLVRTALSERVGVPAPKIKTIPSHQQKAPSGCAFVLPVATGVLFVLAIIVLSSREEGGRGLQVATAAPPQELNQSAVSIPAQAKASPTAAPSQATNWEVPSLGNYSDGYYELELWRDESAGAQIIGLISVFPEDVSKKPFVGQLANIIGNGEQGPFRFTSRFRAGKYRSTV
jgi:hypothetical protein